MVEGKARIACSGIAVAPVFEVKDAGLELEKIIAGSVERELAAFEQAVDVARSQLTALIDSLPADSEAAEIMEMHLMMADDPDLLDPVRKLIGNGGISAVAAMLKAGTEQAEEFKSLDDPYMQARSADILDVSRRIACAAAGVEYQPALSARSIIVADDLTPSQTVGFKREFIAGIVLRHGTMNSHAAILARNMGVPSLIEATELAAGLSGKILVVDAVNGRYYVEPDNETLRHLQEIKNDWDKEQLKLLALRGKEAIAPCGHRILTAANIGTPDEIEFALDNDCEGVGLMRSEFLFIGRDDYPSEEEQYQAYARVASALNGRPLIIRTLDIGADKKCPYFNLPAEENPALGLRALRICLTRPELFKIQLRSICRAAARGKIRLMLPMVISITEIQKTKALLQECAHELSLEGKEYVLPPVGIMIETPAAAVLSATLAKEVDFFSIGTNDLMQYTCAIDRQNPRLEPFYDPHHPAVLELIRQTAVNAHQAGIFVGICGEMASDPVLTDLFIEFGIDELSVSPSRILALRHRILNSHAHCLNERPSNCNF